MAAAYLKNVYRHKIQRVAIVDFDVHHGNGTQEIIECMQAEKTFREPPNMSILYDNDPRSVTVYKPWLDDHDGKNVLFQSIHLHGKNFYPNTGGFPAISEADINKQLVYKPGGIFNYPIYPGTAKCSKWRKTFSEQIIPKLVAFKPDFILISAGFDAHEKDHIHLTTDTTITEFDYKWVTEQINQVANLCCQGRVVSILEGGYSTKAGPISPLA